VRRSRKLEATLDVSGTFADEAIRLLVQIAAYIDKGEP
jgi:hypothetical protein